MSLGNNDNYLILEFTKLKEENERLRKACELVFDESAKRKFLMCYRGNDFYVSKEAMEAMSIALGYSKVKAEVERLRASSFVTAVPVEQYEKLIKAGDAMAKNYFETYWTLYNDSETRYEPASITDWEEAKKS